MKKVLLAVAIVATFGLTSCGGGDLCECIDKVSKAESMDDIKALEGECKDVMEKATEEDMKKCMEKESGKEEGGEEESH